MLKRYVLLCGLVLSPRAGWAQDIDRARQLFQEASQLREAGLYADAVVRLRQAIAIKDTPGLEYHAGFCEAKLGHYRSAIRYYERAAELLRQGATAPDVANLLPPAHAAALERAAKLRVSVRTDGANALAQLQLDDEPVQPVPEGDILVDAGKHRLVFSAPGRRSDLREVSVSEGEILNLQVSLSPNSSVAPGATADQDPFPWKTVGIGFTLGVTATGLGIGIVSAVNRNQAHDQIDFYMRNDPSNAGLSKANSDRSSAIRWETIGFISAGVGAVATAALWALWPSSKPASVSVLPTGATQLSVAAEF